MRYRYPTVLMNNRWLLRWRLAIGAFAVFVISLPIVAAERRAKPPQFDSQQFRGIFYSDVGEAVASPRPTAPELRGATARASGVAAPSAAEEPKTASGATGIGWAALISATTLEDEIKRLKLEFDGIVTTPGPFAGGGYRQARVTLSIMAMLFAVIDQYDGDVRWKDQAPAARDLLARSAANSKAGSVQVYNEAKLRKADLQDLVSGTGLTVREVNEDMDWTRITDRGPLMEYLEWAFQEELQANSNNQATVTANADTLKQFAEMVAVIGMVLIQEEMEEADDEDYVRMSKEMISAAQQVRDGLAANDADRVRLGVGAIGQACTACHEQFR